MTNQRRCATWCLALLLLASGLIVVPTPAKADTYVSGIITTDTTWNSTGSPYIVVGNLTVAVQANLTISGNVVIRVDPNVTITIQGALRANPSGGLGATFTNNSTGRWGGIIADNARLFRVVDSQISSSSAGIFLNSTQRANMGNIKMSNNTIDLKLVNSTGNIVNSTVNWSRVSVDATSRLAVGNVLRIYVGDMNGGLRDADMQVRDGNRNVYATKGYGGNDQRTNPKGYSPPILVADRTYVGSNLVENRTFLNVSYHQFKFQMREADMFASHVESFVITEPYLAIGKIATKNQSGLLQPLPVRILVQAHGLNNTTAATNITVFDLLPLDIKYVPGSSTRPIWESKDAQGRFRLQWNITKMNASESWNVTYGIYGTQPGLKSISLIPPSCVNYTANSTKRNESMPDVKVRFVEIPLSIRITSPAGFAVWRILSQQYINWTASGGRPPVRVNVAYRPLTSQQYTNISKNQPANGSIQWQVPMTALGPVTIRCQARDSVGNITNATATVLVIPGFFVLITPATASVPIDRTQKFTARAIEANGTPIPSDKVLFTWSLGNTTVGKIDPAAGTETTFTPIAPGTDTLTCLALYQGSPSAGLASVTVPVPPPPVVTLISPSGGDRYPAGAEVNITWKVTSIATPLKVNISYSKDGGASYTDILKGFPQPAAGSAYHLWTLPSNLNSDRMIVNVTVSDKFDQAGSDESGEFSILVPLEIKYISGSNQTGDVASKLKEPLVVQILAAGFTPLEGIDVNWSMIASPNGSTMHGLDLIQTVTDSAGISRVYFTLGQRPGTYRIAASLNGSSLPPVEFEESAVPGALSEAYIFPTSADVTVGEEVRFTLTLYDTYNNTISPFSANVTWSVKGAGSVIKGAFSSSQSGDADVFANITYKGKTISVSAHVKVHAQDTSMGWLAIGLILAVLLIVLFILLYRRRVSRKPPRIEEEKELEPISSEEEKEPESEKSPKEEDSSKQELSKEKKPTPKKPANRLLSTRLR